MCIRDSLLCNRTLAIYSKQKIVCTKVKSVYRNQHQLRQFTIKTSKDDLNLLSVIVSRTLTPKSKELSNQGRVLVCTFCKRFPWKSKEDTCLKSRLRASSLAGWDVGRENEVRACNDLSAIWIPPQMPPVASGWCMTFADCTPQTANRRLIASFFWFCEMWICFLCPWKTIICYHKNEELSTPRMTRSPMKNHRRMKMLVPRNRVKKLEGIIENWILFLWLREHDRNIS